MTVRAKFKCWGKTQNADGTYSYHFEAVTSGSVENESFWKWTPSGTLDMNALKGELFEVNKEYYLDFNASI